MFAGALFFLFLGICIDLGSSAKELQSELMESTIDDKIENWWEDIKDRTNLWASQIVGKFLQLWSPLRKQTDEKSKNRLAKFREQFHVLLENCFEDIGRKVREWRGILPAEPEWIDANVKEANEEINGSIIVHTNRFDQLYQNHTKLIDSFA